MLVFTPASFSSTQGQWWKCFSNDGIERRVSLVASQAGFFLWDASFRHARTRQVVDRRWFCSKAGSSEPIAFFNSPGDRHQWLEEQYKETQAA